MVTRRQRTAWRGATIMNRSLARLACAVGERPRSRTLDGAVGADGSSLRLDSTEAGGMRGLFSCSMLDIYRNWRRTTLNEAMNTITYLLYGILKPC